MLLASLVVQSLFVLLWVLLVIVSDELLEILHELSLPIVSIDEFTH